MFKNTDDRHKKTAAVIITGGSSGIGMRFIECLLKVNRNLLICNLSRSKPDINFVGDSLVHLPCDLANSSDIDKTLVRIKTLFEERQPKGELLLINNAGLGTYGQFGSAESGRDLRMVAVNVNAVIHLTHALLPLIKKHGGGCINIASTAAFQPTPYLATYGATKAFLLSWSLGLREELRGSNVHILCVCPGPTHTNFFTAAGFSKSPISGRMGHTADDVVAGALRAYDQGKGLWVTGFSNKLMTFFSSIGPKRLVSYLSGLVLKRVRKG